MGVCMVEVYIHCILIHMRRPAFRRSCLMLSVCICVPGVGVIDMSSLAGKVQV